MMRSRREEMLIVLSIMGAIVVAMIGAYYLMSLEEADVKIVKAEVKPQTWWIIPSAVSWRTNGKTILNWGGGDGSYITLRGHHDILPGSTYKLELTPTGISSEYEVVSIRIVQR